MTRQFRKREDLHLVIIPGMGRLRPNQILSGDQYAKFVPHLLEEVLPAKSVAPVVPAVVAPAVPTPAAPVPELVVKKSSPPPVETPAPVEEAVLFVEEPVEAPVVEAPAEAPAEEPSEDSEEDTDSELEDGEAEGEPAPAEHHQHAGTVAAPPRRKRGRPRKGS